MWTVQILGVGMGVFVACPHFGEILCSRAAMLASGRAFSGGAWEVVPLQSGLSRGSVVYVAAICFVECFG